MGNRRLKQGRDGTRGVSVIIPVFNRWNLAERALRSALAQTFPAFEVIMVDDGSTIPAPSSLTEDPDKRFSLVSLEENRGAAAARNFGVDRAKYSMIAFLDSDDAWSPGKLERQFHFMEYGPHPNDVSCTGYYYARKIGTGRSYIEVKDTTKTVSGRALLDGCYLSPGSTLMVRKTIFKEIGPMDQSLSRLEDWDWMMRASRRVNIKILPEPLCYVEQQGLPNYADVLTTVRSLWKLQRGLVREEFGLSGQLCFRASLFLEAAVACSRGNQPALAMMYVLLAILSNPSRVFRFFHSCLSRNRKNLTNIDDRGVHDICRTL